MDKSVEIANNAVEMRVDLADKGVESGRTEAEKPDGELDGELIHRGWDGVARALALAEGRWTEEGFAAHERLLNPDGLCLRDMLEAAEDAEGRMFVLESRLSGLLESGLLTPERARRYAHHAARGLLAGHFVDRAFDKASLLRAQPELEAKLTRATDGERRRRTLEESLRRRGPLGLTLGIEPLDALINEGRGIRPGEALLVTGHEGTLKTALATNALCGYVQAGGRALLVSLDMAPERIEERLLMRLVGCGPEELRELVRRDAPAYREARAAREAEDGRLLILGGPLGLEAVRSAALASGAEVVALDYVTAVSGFNSEWEAVRAVAPLFRELTRRWGLTGVLLSQMSVASVKDQAQGGTGSHAMGGGTLSQFVDFELELFKDGIAEGSADQGSPLVATLRKNRSGRSGESFRIFPEYPSLRFRREAQPVERAIRRKPLFRPTGAL